MARVAREHEVPVIKITSGQRIALVGIEPDRYDDLWQQLEMAVGRVLEPCLHYVQACPGDQWCYFGIQDSIGLGLDIEERFAKRGGPAKMKIGVSGCNFCCAESYVRDIGVIATKKGWTVTFGGNSGGKPRIGDELARHLQRDAAIDLIDRLIALYAEHGQDKKRTARFVEKRGIDWIKQQLGLS